MRVLMLSASCWLAAAMQPARAQSAAAQTPSADQDNEPAQLQEVVVTASLRKETAQNVPASLQVLSGAQLDRLGDQSTEQFAALVPGLQLTETQPGIDVQTLRGISTGLQGTSPTVADYLDDTPLTATNYASGGQELTADPDLYDMQRIEVLKGPQGTLYGAASEGGLIKYVLNQPNLEDFGGSAEAGFEGIPDHGTGNSAHVVVNIPVVADALAIRLNGFRVASPGYIDNTFTGQRNVNLSLTEGGRASILWKPFDAFSANLTTYYQDLSSENPSAEDAQPLTLQPTDGSYKVATRVPLPLYSKLFVNSLALNYDFGWATLLSDTSLQKQYTSLHVDYSNIYGPEFGRLIGGNATSGSEISALKKVTEEVRLTSRSGGTLDWLAGFYYTHEDTQLPETFSQYEAVGGTDTLVYPDALSANVSGSLRETAVYGNLTYHFGPSFDLQGGLRYSHVAQQFGEADIDELGATAPNVSGSASTSKVTYLGTARYHFSRDNMLYARVATGYRPGGANTVVPGVSTPPSYQPDTVTDYELGFKGAFPRSLIDYSLDVYRINWQNIQYVGADQEGFSFIVNGGRAHSQGVELAFNSRPLPGLQVGLSGAFGQAKLDEGISALDGQAAAGSELPYAPKVSYAATVDYEHPLTASMSGFAGLTLAGTGARRAYYSGQIVGIPAFGPGFASTTGDLPAYATLDLRGGIRDGRVTTTVYVHNVTNTVGAIGLDASFAGVDLTHGTVGPGLLTITQPRTFGVTVRYDF